MPPDAIGREAFVRDGKYYGYFGPAPALPRAPLNVLFPGMYGRWSRFSMLCGTAFALAMLILLFRRLEKLLRLKGALWSALRIMLILAAGLGSTTVFLSTESRVFEEAILWGAALAFGQAVFLAHFLLDRKTKWLVLACVTAALAFLTRISSGAGAVLSLALLDAAILIPSAAWRGFWGVEKMPSLRRPVSGLTATVLGCGILWAGLNYWKYGMLFTSQPIRLTIDSDLQRLQRTKGDPFSVTNVPLTLSVYSSPANIQFRSSFPWAYLTPPDRSIGARFPYSHFDGIENNAGLPAAAPGLLAYALAGMVLCFLPRRAALRPFRAPLCGAFGGIFVTLGWGYVTYRYLHDLLPWLLLGSAIGLAHVALMDRGWARRTAAAAFAAATIYGAWLNFAFAAVDRRYTFYPGPDDKRVAFSDLREAIDRRGLAGAADHLAHRRLYVPAAKFASGNADVFGGVFTLRPDQLVIRRDADGPGLVQYRVGIPGDGVYELAILYASAERRPMRLAVNGQAIPRPVCSEPTGGWYQTNQRWAVAGLFRMSAGTVDLELASDGKLPVIRMLRFVKRS